MKVLWTAVFAVSVAGAASAALLSVTDAPVDRAVFNSAVAEGVIDAVAEDKKSFTLRTAENSVSIKVTDDTAYTLNGEASTLDEAVQPGRDAKVTHTDMVATNVDVTTEA